MTDNDKLIKEFYEINAKQSYLIGYMSASLLAFSYDFPSCYAIKINNLLKFVTEFRADSIRDPNQLECDHE